MMELVMILVITNLVITNLGITVAVLCHSRHRTRRTAANCKC